MTTIVKRTTKGSPLTHAEVDANFENLNQFKVEQDAAGNIGVGVTPSAWVTPGQAVEMPGGAIFTSGIGYFGATQNAFYNTSGVWKYKAALASTLYSQSGGVHSWFVAPSGTAGATVTWTQAMTLDASSNLLLTGGGGLGYGTGSGGTVTQLTSKSTAVTLNKPSGQITMNAAALAAGASVAFGLNNSAIGANDVVLVNVTGSGAMAQSYSARAGIGAAGTAYITVKNETGGSLSEAVVLNFVVIKGATS